MARWLEQVRRQIPETQGEALTKPTKAPSVSFVSASGGVFQKNQALGEINAKPAQALESLIHFARSEAELDQVAEELQAGFVAGHLSQAQAERVTYLVLDTARQLARGLYNVPVGVL